jgi:hypothetical protein
MSEKATTQELSTRKEGRASAVCDSLIVKLSVRRHLLRITLRIRAKETASCPSDEVNLAHRDRRLRGNCEYGATECSTSFVRGTTIVRQ